MFTAHGDGDVTVPDDDRTQALKERHEVIGGSTRMNLTPGECHGADAADVGGSQASFPGGSIKAFLPDATDGGASAHHTVS
jgi:hypothetical protein